MLHLRAVEEEHQVEVVPLGRTLFELPNVSDHVVEDGVGSTVVEEPRQITTRLVQGLAGGKLFAAFVQSR